MYQPSRGAARRLGPCLRAYQARPQVRAEGKREGRGRGDVISGYSTVTLWVTLLPIKRDQLPWETGLLLQAACALPQPPVGLGHVLSNPLPGLLKIYQIGRARKQPS